MLLCNIISFDFEECRTERRLSLSFESFHLLTVQYYIRSLWLRTVPLVSQRQGRGAEARGANCERRGETYGKGRWTHAL